MVRIILIISILVLSSCALPIIGGGIAGAGMDSLWVRKGAENYHGFTSSEVTVSHITNYKITTKNDRSDLFSRFPSRITIPEETPINFAGVFITYAEQNISITKNGQQILTEDIPSAFYYSGLQVASIDFQGIPYLLIATYSRATTGMVWIGLYRADGTRLYTHTLKIGEIWDTIPDSDGIIIAGNSDSIKITLNRIHDTKNTE